MKFVLTHEEIQDFLKAFTPTFREARGLVTVLETTPEFVREVLPPPLEPGEAPMVGVVLVKSIPLNIMAVGVACRFGDIVGDYGLGMVLDADHPITYGRELWGEPKKLGEISLERVGDRAVGVVSRKGHEVFKVAAQIQEPVDPAGFSSADLFHFKYSIRPDATGIEDARLVHIHMDNDVRSVEACAGEAAFGTSPNDLYGDIPVVGVKAMFYVDMDQTVRGRYAAEVESERLLPYAFAKHDDYRLLGF
jgi:acetoacetate decarboxylase